MTTQTIIEVDGTNLTYAQYQNLLAALNNFKATHPEITKIVGQFIQSD